MRKMERKNNKEGMKHSQSHSHFSLTQNKTLAELNHLSTRSTTHPYHPSLPLRVVLPDYFNVPRFTDHDLFQPLAEEALFAQRRAESQLQRKVKDIAVLAQGMRRAKNIKEESRYYFTQGVLQHNCRAYNDSITSLQKFLKIVLFIRDEKSVELALNAIGCEYMVMGQPETAIEYHRKQGSTGVHPDRFLSHTNCGLCFQLASDYQSALQEYVQAERVVALDASDSRRRFISKLIKRASSKREQVFLTTEQPNEYSPSSPPKQHCPSSPPPGMSKARIVQAIRSAQKKLSRFMCQKKESFLE